MFSQISRILDQTGAAYTPMFTLIPDGKVKELCNGKMPVLPTALIDLNDQEVSLRSLEGTCLGKFSLSFFSAFFIFLAS